MYDIPRNGHGNYDVPRSIPVEHVPENYQVPISPAHALHAAITKSPARRGADVYENMPSESDVNYCGDDEPVSINYIELLCINYCDSRFFKQLKMD